MPTNLNNYFLGEPPFEPLPPPEFTEDLIERALATWDYTPNPIRIVQTPFRGLSTYEEFRRDFEKKKKSMSNPDSYDFRIETVNEGIFTLTIKFDEVFLYEEMFTSMNEAEDKLHEVLEHLIKTGKILEEGGL